MLTLLTMRQTCVKANIPDPMILQAFQSLIQPMHLVKRKKLKYAVAQPQPRTSAANQPVYRVDAEDAPALLTGAESDEKKPSLDSMFKMPTMSPSNATSPSPAANFSKSSAALQTDILAFSSTAKLTSFVDASVMIHSEFDREHELEGGLLTYFQPDYQFQGTAENIVGKREIFPFWKRESGCQLLLQCQSLRMAPGDLTMIEPLYCTLSLYDLKHRMRVSEDFRFDLNRADILTGQLSVGRGSADQITLARACCFKVSDVHEGLHLVLRMDRVLQGDADDANESYLKDKPRSASDLKRLSDNCKEQINRLSMYRQMFALAVVPLFSDTGELLLTQNSVMDKLYVVSDQPEEKIYLDMLTALAQGNNSYKLKLVVRGQFAFSLQILGDDERPACVMDPTYIPLKMAPKLIQLDTQDDKKQDQAEVQRDLKQGLKSSFIMVVKEIEEFPHSAVVQPYTHYVHNLYVYPTGCEFQKSRNIAVRMQLRTTDDLLDDASGRNCVKGIFGGSSGSVFNTQALFGVTYHSLTPSFADEIKIMLPYALSDQVHLFFTFYQVACQHKIGKGVQEIIGYSLLRLYPHARMLDDGDYSLPIASILPDKNYLMGFISNKVGKDTKVETIAGKRVTVDLGEYQWHEDGKLQFHLRLKLQSSIFNQDQFLTSMFQSFPSDSVLRTGSKYAMEQVAKSVENLRFASPQSLIQFLIPVMNFLLRILGTGCALAQAHAFYGLVYVTEGITGYLKEATTERCPMLMTYIQNMLMNFESEPEPATSASNSSKVAAEEPSTLYCNVVKNWFLVLNEMKCESPTPLQQAVLKHSWLWMELSFKSLVLDTNDFEQPVERVAQSHETFLAHMDELVEVLSDVVTQHRKLPVVHLKRLNANLAVFLMDLFCVCKKSPMCLFSCLILVHTLQLELYVKGLDARDSVILEMKSSFIQLMVDSDWFIEICQPCDISNEMLAEIEPITIKDRIKEMFPLPWLVVDHVVKQCDFITVAHRYRVIDLLRLVLTRFDYDSRFQAEDLKAQIAAIFFPLVPMLSARSAAVGSLTPQLQRNLLVCWLWVLRFAPRNLLRFWWRSEVNQSTLAGLLTLLQLALALFSFSGRSTRSLDSEIRDCLLSSETSAQFVNEAGATSGATLRRAGGGGGVTDLLADLEQINASHLHSRVAGGTMVGPSSSTAAITASGTVRGRAPVQLSSASVAPNRPATLTAPPAVDGGGGTIRQIRQQMMAAQALRKTGGGGGTVRGAAPHMTVSSNEFIAKLLNWEVGVNQSVSRLLLSLVCDLMADRTALLLEQPLSLAQARRPPAMPLTTGTGLVLLNFPALSIATLAALLHVNQPDDVCLVTYPMMRFVLASHSRSWFAFVHHHAELHRRSTSLTPLPVADLALAATLSTLTLGTSASPPSARVPPPPSVPKLRVEETAAVGAGRPPRLNRVASSVVASRCDIDANEEAALELQKSPRGDSLDAIKADAESMSVATQLMARIEQLCTDILQHASYAPTKMRAHAVTLLHALFRDNYLACAGDLTLMQNVLTTSLSCLIDTGLLPRMRKQLAKHEAAAASGGISPSAATLAGLSPGGNAGVLGLSGFVPFVNSASVCLEAALAALIQLAETNLQHQPLPSEFPAKVYVAAVRSVVEKANIILRQSLEIARQEHFGKAADPSQQEDLLLQMADVHAHLPEVRIAWLRKLVLHHQTVGNRNEEGGLHNHAEAGQCLVEIARLMHLQASSASYTDRLMKPITTASVVMSASVAAAAADETTPRHVLALLEACQELDKAQLYEQCYDTYQPCLDHYLTTRNYAQLAICHQHIFTVMDKLVNEDKVQQRLFGTYYRVGFYGSKFGVNLHGKEFVFKKQKICRLPEITNDLKAKYSQQFGTPIKVHPNSSPLDVAQLNPDESLLQITVLKPCWPQEQDKYRQSYKERNTNLLTFSFSTPFTATGGSHGQDVTQQMKRNSTVHVSTPFPSFTTKQLVAQRVELVLQPADSVAEDIQQRTAVLEEVLNQSKRVLINLQPLMHGMLLASVNGGTMPICKAFLSVEYRNLNPQAKLANLRAMLSNQMALLRRGLEAHKQLSSVESDQEMQKEFEKSFEKLEEDMLPYLVDDEDATSVAQSHMPQLSSSRGSLGSKRVKKITKVIFGAVASTETAGSEQKSGR